MMKSLLNKKRVLITGGEGFIGSHLTHKLAELGANVFVIAHPREDLWRLKDLLKTIKVFRVDIEDFASLRKIMDKISPCKVYHLAAITKRENTPENALLVARKNIIGTINLVAALDKGSYDCFVNIGTSDEYAGNPIPFYEEQPPNPISFYAASKTANWYFCKIFYNKLGLPIINLRFFLVYGPKQNTGFFIPELIISSLKRRDFKMTLGEQTRDFIFVGDIIDGIIKASLRKEAVGQTINFCSGNEYQLREIAEKVRKLTGKGAKILYGAIPYRNNEIGRIVGDNSKARNIINWRPRVTLEKGLKITVDWYRDNLGKY